MRKTTWIVVVTAVTMLVAYLGFWYKYITSMDGVSRDWYEKEYLGKDIKGTIKTIDFYASDSAKIALLIKNEGEEFDISYGVICVNKEFNSFVAEGDSVFKSPGRKTLRFCKSRGRCAEYELNFCGKFGN